MPHLRGDFGGERQNARRRRIQGFPLYQPRRRRPLYHPTLAPLPAVPTNASYIMPHHPLHFRLRGPTPPACPARWRSPRSYVVAFVCLVSRGTACYAPSISSVLLPGRARRTHRQTHHHCAPPLPYRERPSSSQPRRPLQLPLCRRCRPLCHPWHMRARRRRARAPAFATPPCCCLAGAVGDHAMSCLITLYCV